MVDEGCADYVLAFEPLEAMRALPYLKKEGTVIVNTQQIMPMPVISGAAVYPQDVLERLARQCRVVALGRPVPGGGGGQRQGGKPGAAGGAQEVAGRGRGVLAEGHRRLCKGKIPGCEPAGFCAGPESLRRT